MSDHPRPEEMGHGHGESEEQHQMHSSFPHKHHFGLPPYSERTLFYMFAIPSWCFEIVAAVFGSLKSTTATNFIWSVSAFLVLNWAAWWQTAVSMAQRSSWTRDESDLPDRRRYLYFAVRLNRLMLPTGSIAFVTFIVAYVRRNDTHDIVNWLLFLLVFIFNCVGCVMNAYNNITWESDRLEYEDGSTPYGRTYLAILGIPSKPSKKRQYLEE